MTKHVSQPFNPDISSVLFRAGMIEAWGRGIEKVTGTCKNAKGVRLKIKYDPGGLLFNFYFEPLLVSVETSAENSHTLVKNAEAGIIPGTTQQAILHLMSSYPEITLSAISKKLERPYGRLREQWPG
jgi:ATP-dependent DNA helicase RecG